jgi:hypothetical protein
MGDPPAKDPLLMEPSPTWMYSLLIRLSSGAFLFIALGLIAASTLVFLLNIESLMTNGGMGSLIAITVAAAMLLSAVRAMCVGNGQRPVVATIAFLFLMSGVASLGALFCRNHSMRVPFAAMASVLVLAGAFYSIRYLPRQPQRGAIS